MCHDQICVSFSSPQIWTPVLWFIFVATAQLLVASLPGHCFSSGRPKPQSWGVSHCTWPIDGFVGFVGPIDGWDMLGLANPGIMFLGSGCQCSTLIILDHGENMQIKPTAGVWHEDIWHFKNKENH